MKNWGRGANVQDYYFMVILPYIFCGIYVSTRIFISDLPNGITAMEGSFIAVGRSAGGFGNGVETSEI